MLGFTRSKWFIDALIVIILITSIEQAYNGFLVVQKEPLWLLAAIFATVAFQLIFYKALTNSPTVKAASYVDFIKSQPVLRWTFVIVFLVIATFATVVFLATDSRSLMTIVLTDIIALGLMLPQK